MLRFDGDQAVLHGPAGTLTVSPHDEVTRKLAMLYEGQCEGLGPTKAARKFGYCKQRYFQVLHAFLAGGAALLVNRKRGPKKPYRRTIEVLRQVIRHRFLDPDASADVIAQKLRQAQWAISTRSVQRVIEEYGLQKKTL